MRIRKLIFMMVFLVPIYVGAGACGNDSGNNNGPAPTQADIDNVVAQFTEFGQAAFPLGGTCAQTCQDLNGGASAFSGPTDCPGGGSGSVSITDCDSNGSFTFSLSLDNCTDADGNMGNGTIIITLTATASQVVIDITASGFTTEGFTFTGDVTTTVPCENGVYGAATCSGSASSGGETCDLTSDCSACNL